jgi:hypothetical protein
MISITMAFDLKHSEFLPEGRDIIMWYSLWRSELLWSSTSSAVEVDRAMRLINTPASINRIVVILPITLRLRLIIEYLTERGVDHPYRGVLEAELTCLKM